MGWTADTVNQELNRKAAAYYLELDKRKSCLATGKSYKDLVLLDQKRSDFYEVIYHNLCYFYLRGLSQKQRELVFESGLGAFSNAQLAILEDKIEQITEVYSDLLGRLPMLAYDPSRPFANYLHATVAPKIKGNYERFIHEDELKRLDSAVQEIDSKHPEGLRQEEKAELLAEYFKRYFPDEKRSRAFFSDYLRGRHGIISLDLPIGDTDSTLAEFIEDKRVNQSPDHLVELNDLLSRKEAFFLAAKTHYLEKKRKGKINPIEFFQTYRHRIECETGLKLASPEDLDLDEKLLQKSLAKHYQVSESAISQEKNKLFKAFRAAWEEVYAK